MESLSRGAISATFVDQAPWAQKVIEKNLASLGISNQGTILMRDISSAVKRLEKAGQGFSLIFVDPPFMKGLVKKTLMRLDASDIVLPFAQVVVGHMWREELPNAELKNLKWVRTKRIGQACLSFFFRLESKNEKTKSYIYGEL